MHPIKLKDVLNEVLDWKEIPDEERAEANKLIQAHNTAATIDPGIKGYYAIDVTGRHQVYYTFWRYRDDIDPRIAQLIKNPIYFGNLTTNYLSSVKKALEHIPPTMKLVVWTDENRHHLIGKPERFTFGKYRGEPYHEVFLKDPSYFAWLAKNQDPQYANTKSALAIKLFADMYFEQQTKKNQETSTSKFVGTEGGSYEGELKIYNIAEKQGQSFGYDQKPETYLAYKLVDAEGNKFLAVNLNKNFPNAKKDDTIKVRGKIKAHKELMGIKFTALNYVKPA